jgi:two-component system heavy metal sensor histidine kinase CusS
MKRHSLTIRLVVLFGLLSFTLLSLIGVSLYGSLKRQVIAHDEMRFTARVERVRTLLEDPRVFRLALERPQILQDVLGNSAYLSVGPKDGAPLIQLNTHALAVPALAVTPVNAGVSPQSLYRAAKPDGSALMAVAAAVRRPDGRGELQIVAADVTDESMLLLENCRDRILLQIAIATLAFAAAGSWLVRRGLQPLRRLAAQAETITVSRLDARFDGDHAASEMLPVIDSFNAMLARLRFGFGQLSQVCADMAHDLRTPINNLLGEAEVVLSQPRSQEEYEQTMVSHMEELQRLSKMIDSMLFLARSDNPTTEIERKALSVAAELRCVAEYFEVLTEERWMGIDVEGAGTIYADPILLRRALANLVANAVQYADGGTRILLQACRTDDGMRISVENRGPTIPAQHLERVFDRFYRADASRRGSSSASGLGLSIVRTIVSLHHGSWRASSADDVTRFELIFPDERKPGPAAPETRSGLAAYVLKRARMVSSLARFAPKSLRFRREPERM